MPPTFTSEDLDQTFAADQKRLNFLGSRTIFGGSTFHERINTLTLENVYSTVSLLQNKELLFREMHHSHSLSSVIGGSNFKQFKT